MWLAAALSATLLSLSACAPEIEHRGYIPKPGSFSQIHDGMGKTDVEAALGSPSTTASIKFQGDSYYYITSITEHRAFLNPSEVNRDVIAIRFDKQDKVQSFAQYTMKDGRIIDINSDQTPVVGEDLSMLQEIFRGMLNSNASVGNSVLSRKM
jgi:outer membrane protein assembly factor BamE (lipoprotein component of BamABCDE complex)